MTLANTIVFMACQEVSGFGFRVEGFGLRFGV